MHISNVTSIEEAEQGTSMAQALMRHLSYLLTVVDDVLNLTYSSMPPFPSMAHYINPNPRHPVR